MGGAVMIGLGVAAGATKLPVVVITAMRDADGGRESRDRRLQKPGTSPHRADNEVYGETAGSEPHGVNRRPRRRCQSFRIIGTRRPLRPWPRSRLFTAPIQDVSSGPRFASIKIDSANLERVLASRDGSFIVTRIRGALGFGPI